MEEEKKNNKGLLIGIIIFLCICLVAIFYFMFKMTYVENKTNSNEKQEETTKSEEEAFTELTKYELQEGEEKEVTINNKKIVLKRKDNKYYIGDKEIEEKNSIAAINITNQFILFETIPGQFGVHYYIYDFEGNKIDSDIEDAQYNNLKINKGKLYVDAFIYKTHWMDGYVIGNLSTVPGGSGDCSKKLSDYPEIIEEHKNDVLEGDYYFDYSNNKVTLKVENVKLTVEQLAKESPNTCVEENI